MQFDIDRKLILCGVVLAGADTAASSDLITQDVVTLVVKCSGDMNGLRIGTPDLVRWGVTTNDADHLARLIARALATDAPETLLAEVSDYRKTFDRLHFMTHDADSP